LTDPIGVGKTFGFKFFFHDDSAGDPEIELKYGVYGVKEKQQMFSIAEIPVVPPAVATVSGTITDAAAESDIISGGRTIFIDLFNDTWVADDGTFADLRDEIIAGLVSAQGEANGWDAEVVLNQDVAGVVRTTDTRVTITLDAQVAYAITADETITTVTVPEEALVTTTGSDLTAAPTFDISDQGRSAALTGTLADNAGEAQIISGGQSLIITLVDTTWDATIGADNALTTALIDGLVSAGAETNGWNNVVKDGLTHTAVTRTNDSQVTITLPAFGGYDISADETITVTVPEDAVAGAGDIVATPTFDIQAPAATISGTITPWATKGAVVAGGKTIVIDLTGCRR